MNIERVMAIPFQIAYFLIFYKFWNVLPYMLNGPKPTQYPLLMGGVLWSTLPASAVATTIIIQFAIS